MNHDGTLSAEEMGKFKRITNLFTTKYREYFKNKRITTKFHIVESHLLNFVEQYGSLRQFSEETIGAHHPFITKLGETYNHFRNQEKKEYFMFRRLNRKSDAMVIKTMESYEAYKRAEGEKRKRKKPTKAQESETKTY